MGGLATLIAADHYTNLNSWEASRRPEQLTITSRFSTPGRPRDAHRSLPLYQDLQLLTGLDRSLPSHPDPQLLGGLVTPSAACHCIKIFNSWEALWRPPQPNNALRFSTLGRPRNLHRSLPLHQKSSILGRPRDAHRSLPLHRDLQLLGGLVTPSAAYHYIKLFNSCSGGLVTPTAVYPYIKIFNSWEAL